MSRLSRYIKARAEKTKNIFASPYPKISELDDVGAEERLLLIHMGQMYF